MDKFLRGTFNLEDLENVRVEVSAGRRVTYFQPTAGRADNPSDVGSGGSSQSDDGDVSRTPQSAPSRSSSSNSERGEPEVGHVPRRPVGPGRMVHPREPDVELEIRSGDRPLKFPGTKMKPRGLKFKEDSEVIVTHVESVLSFTVLENSSNSQIVRDINKFVRQNIRSLIKVEDIDEESDSFPAMVLAPGDCIGEEQAFFRAEVVGGKVHLKDVGGTFDVDDCEGQLYRLPVGLDFSTIPPLSRLVGLFGLKEDGLSEAIDDFKLLVGLGEGLVLRARLVYRFRDRVEALIILTDADGVNIADALVEVNDDVSAQAPNVLLQDLGKITVSDVAEKEFRLDYVGIANTGQVLMRSRELYERSRTLLAKAAKDTTDTFQSNQMVLVNVRDNPDYMRMYASRAKPGKLELIGCDEQTVLVLERDGCSGSIFCWKETGRVLDIGATEYAVYLYPEIMRDVAPSLIALKVDVSDADMFEKHGPFTIADVVEDRVILRTSGGRIFKKLSDTKKVIRHHTQSLVDLIKDLPFGYESDGRISHLDEETFWIILDEDETRVVNVSSQITELAAEEFSAIFRNPNLLPRDPYEGSKKEPVLLLWRKQNAVAGYRGFILDVTEDTIECVRVDYGDSFASKNSTVDEFFLQKSKERIVLPWPGTESWKAHFGGQDPDSRWHDLSVEALKTFAHPCTVEDELKDVIKTSFQGDGKLRFYVKGFILINGIRHSIISCAPIT